jgi:hypothetical protein
LNNIGSEDLHGHSSFIGQLRLKLKLVAGSPGPEGPGFRESQHIRSSCLPQTTKAKSHGEEQKRI